MNLPAAAHAKPLIAAENLTIAMAARPSLTDQSRHPPGRDRSTLIGPNGSGKTTLVRALLGLAPAVSGRMSATPAGSAMCRNPLPVTAACL